MNLWFRLIRVFIVSFLAPRMVWDEKAEVKFRVWLNDLDTNLHMNNARYLALMDLGRLNLIVRSGLGPIIKRDRLMPVIAGSLVRFRRPLQLFEPITLSTQVIGWDAKWMFLEQRIERRGELACHAIVKAAFLSKQGTVPPPKLAEAVGHNGISPPLPEWITSWMDAERGIAERGLKA